MVGLTHRYEVLICGVGGQGVLVLTDILAEAANQLGIPVRGSETHGMSQRGGSIVANIRMGKVWASLTSPGEADVVMGLEPIEALRNAPYVKRGNGGVILFSTHHIPPPHLTYSRGIYPDLETITKSIGEYCNRVVKVDAVGLAKEVGNVRSANIVMLGALSSATEFPITREGLISAMNQRFHPKFAEANEKAFELGEKAVRATSIM
jgi:indolepyruvate ferredoxin oxidoreductase beta subunit